MRFIVKRSNNVENKNVFTPYFLAQKWTYIFRFTSGSRSPTATLSLPFSFTEK